MRLPRRGCSGPRIFSGSQHMMTRRTLLGLGVALIWSLLPRTPRGQAVEREDKTLTGTWTRKEGELRLEFSDRDVLSISPHGKDEFVLIRCKYTADPSGIGKSKVTELQDP